MAVMIGLSIFYFTQNWIFSFSEKKENSKKKKIRKGYERFYGGVSKPGTPMCYDQVSKGVEQFHLKSHHPCASDVKRRGQKLSSVHKEAHKIIFPLIENRNFRKKKPSKIVDNQN